METIDMKLNECEQQMFGQLFTYYDSANSGIVPQSVAKQVLNSSNLEQNVLDQIIELSGSSRLSSLTRQQFYAMLKLVGAAQSGLPLNTDTTNALTIPLPQLSPIVVDTNKQQLISNNSDENSKNESILQMTGHLPPPPTKPSVRSNRRNNQFSNNDNTIRQPIETQNNYNSINNNIVNNVINNSSHNLNENEQQFETETTNSRSSSANDENDESPIDSMIDKTFDYRDKSWSEFNDKSKDKPLNWADYDEEHHLLENEEEDEEEEEVEEEQQQQEIKSNASMDEETEDIWNISEEQKSYYTNQFKAMQSNLNGIITGNKAKDFFEKSNLPIQELSRIWQLSDIDKDGALTLNEFCIAMHLVVLRRNNIELPPQLPPSLITITSIDTKQVSSLSGHKNTDLVTDCAEHNYSSVSSPKYNSDLNEVKTKNAETLSPQNKQWTKFTDSPTHQIVVTATVSPPSTSSSAGLQPLANFDFNTASIVRDPKILHPVAVRLSPDGQPIRYDSTETNNHSLETTVHSANVTDSIRSSAVIQGKRDPPPPPPPRPHKSHGHARSSSLDLNRVIVRSGAANDLISSQIPSYLKVSNSEYGLTASQKEVPNLSLNQRNLGAFQAYRKTRTETSLKNNINNSIIDSLKIRYKFPTEVPIPDPSADSTELWQTIRSFQEYSKVLTNINSDLLRDLIKANEDKHSLELKLGQLSNGCKL